MTAETGWTRIPSRSGASARMREGQYLMIRDPEGQQVSDLIAYNDADLSEVISSGRSIDYASRLFLTIGDILYSNRSNPMFDIVRDDVGRHDFTLTPCSADTFRIIYGDESPHHGCQGNLERAIAERGLGTDDVPIAFNVFMHVDVDGRTGEIKVLPPLSKAGDVLTLRARMDLFVALTACSAGQSNNFSYKPIDFKVTESLPLPLGTAAAAEA